MIFKLWRELTFIHLRDHLPHLPAQLVNPYDPRALTVDEQLVMMSGRARDPAKAVQVIQEAGAASALDMDLRREKPKANKRERLMNWLRRLEGSTPTERVYSDFLKHQKEAAPLKGLYQTSLDKWE